MSKTPPNPDPARLWVDGGARGNPGPAGAGAVLERSGRPSLGRGRYLGEATNNVAEYQALLLGLRLAREKGIRDLTVFSDSELMVRQMQGRYKVRNPGLIRLHLEVQGELPRFGQVAFRHVSREENRAADLLVNRAIDARGDVEL